MRYPGIINFHGGMSRFGVVVAAAMMLLVGSAVRAVEMQDLTTSLPRGYFGEFLWDGDKVMQNVVITFESVRALNEQNAEALGCGSYEDGRQVTKIRVRMFVRLSDLQVEIFELSPEGSGSFETGGSHRGTLSGDYQRIDARWITAADGRRGQLHLRAASSLACAPSSAT
jgi:hypothetical protein